MFTGEAHKTPQLVLADAVPARIIEGYRSAEKRLGLMAMSVTVDDVTSPIFETLIRGAGCDGSVLVQPDAYALLFPGDKLAITPGRRAIAHKLQGILDSINESPNGTGRVTYPYGNRGLRTYNPWAGRNHMKIYQFGDTVLTAGGVNVTGGVYNFADYLLEFEDRDVADWIWDLQERVATSPNLDNKDLSFESDYGTFLVDVGVPGQSQILDEANKLLKRPDIESVLFCSMFRPGGKLEYRLDELQENMGIEKIRILYNTLNHPANLTDLLQSIKQHITPTHHVSEKPADKFIHAKFMIVRYADGSVRTISTSHNFNTSGVMFGTAEIALVSNDPELASLLEKFFDATTGSSS